MMKKIISLLIVFAMVFGCVQITSANTTTNVVGWNVYLEDVLLEEPVAFSGENIVVKMYVENMEKFTAAEVVPSFNSNAAHLISCVDGSEVQPGLYFADSDKYIEPYYEEDPLTSETGVYIDGDFWYSWAMDSEGWENGTLMGIDGNFEVGNDWAFLAFNANESLGLTDLNVDGRKNLLCLNMKADIKTGNDSEKLNLGFKKNVVEVAKEFGIGFAYSRERLSLNKLEYDFTILKCPEDVQDVVYDEENNTVVWNETINRGVTVQLYCNDAPVSGQSFDVDYGTKTADFSTYFANTVPSGEYKVGVTALGADNDAGEVFSNTFEIVNPLDTPDNVLWNEKVLTWDEVENASSYTIELYEEDKLIETITDITATEKDLSEYTKSGKYTAKVTAIGDGEIYGNSEKGDSDELLIQKITGVAQFLYKKDMDHSGIKVTCDGNDYFTESDGTFTIPGLALGKHTLIISEAASLTRTVTVNVTSSGARTINTVENAIGILQGDVVKDGTDINMITAVDVSAAIDETGLDMTDSNRHYDFDRSGQLFDEFSWVIKYYGKHVTNPDDRNYAYENLEF